MAAQDYRLSNALWAVLTVLFIIISSLALGWLARRIARWRHASSETQRRTFIGYSFAGPWIIGFLIFVLGPALISLYYSMTNYQLGQPAIWIGLDNYRELLTGNTADAQQFGQSMFNSLYYALIGVPLQIGFALGMAMLLNREWPLIRAFRTIFYLPVILAGGPAILLAWTYMFTSNGGFVNNVLTGLAHSFVAFDFVYRGFIYLVEGFNGFYAGVSRGDSTGPLMYALPALIGFFVVLTLAFGDWSPGKRNRAWNIAQIIGVIAVYSIAFRTLVVTPVDPSWTYVAAILAVGMIALSASNRQMGRVRALQIGTLILFALGLLLTVIQSGLNFSAGDRANYLLALLLGGGAIGLTVLVSGWDRRKYKILIGACAALGLILLVRLAPGQLDGGRLFPIPAYLTLQSTISNISDLTYLKTTYSGQYLSSLWLYGIVVAVLIGGALLGQSRPHARRILFYAALIGFGLFALSATIDGVRYFHAFDVITQTTGKPTYHFALFSNAIAAFPDDNRLPLWLSNQLWSKPSLILITVWSSGAGMLIFLAALKGVPKSLYEAAQADGANAWQQFRYVTLPMISPATFYNLVIGIIAALQTFDAVYIITGGNAQSPVAESLKSAAYDLYLSTFTQAHIGLGAAISWILAAVILTITAFQFRFGGWVYYEV